VEDAMVKNEYALAGWLAVGGAVLTIPVLALSFALEATSYVGSRAAPAVLLLYATVSIVSVGFGFYSFYRLRSFLNTRFEFHAVDTLIPLLLGLGTLLFVVALAGKAFLVLQGLNSTYGALYLASLGILIVPVSALQIIFAVKLMKLDGDLAGLLKPYAFAIIAAAAFSATIVLLVVGILISAVASVLLGLIYLRAGHEPEVEFV
jgi:hypothetical protein